MADCYANDTVSETAMTANGIYISTRHGRATKLAEMLNFCVLAAKQGLNSKVISLFYDTNSCSCSFELDPSVEEYDEVDTTLLAVARQTICQFEWSGIVNHGAPLYDDVEDSRTKLGRNVWNLG